MRKILIAVMAIALFITACEKNNNNDNDPGFTSETIAMGANSINDVYFSLPDGEVNTVNRTSWDIAFSVPLQTASILINEGAGVELYCVGDTNAWESIDENTITGLEPRFNAETDWNAGAFNVNASGFPNYGWGTYHAGNPDHNVGGDSIYVIKLANASYKKFMVRVKLGATGANMIRWADLNGDNEMTASVPIAPYALKHFIQFSLVANEIIEAEPDKTTWDLLFTRYFIKIPMGPSTFMNYSVMGVLSNPNVVIAQTTGAPEDVTPPAATGDYTDSPDAIGHDWKVYDQIAGTFSLVDSISYFIKSVDGKMYQLYFTEYGGLESGIIDIKLRTIE